MYKNVFVYFLFPVSNLPKFLVASDTIFLYTCNPGFPSTCFERLYGILMGFIRPYIKNSNLQCKVPDKKDELKVRVIHS